MRRAILAALALISLSLTTLAAAPSAQAARSVALAVRDPSIRPAAPGQPVTAAYLGLFNLTAKPVRLTGVTCDCAASVAAHESHEAHGVMQMRPAGAVIVPPHAQLTFAPGGLHLMVMGLKRPIRPGDTVSMRLSFDHLPPMTVKFAAQH